MDGRDHPVTVSTRQHRNRSFVDTLRGVVHWYTSRRTRRRLRRVGYGKTAASVVLSPGAAEYSGAAAESASRYTASRGASPV